MTDRERRIAEMQTELRELKKAARSEKHWKTLADPAVRAKMSAASKAALADPAVRAKLSAARKAAAAEREDRELQPKRKREQRKELGEVPRDALESLIFGGGK